MTDPRVDVAFRLSRALMVRDRDGTLHNPGHGAFLHVVQRDGVSITTESKGDGFDIIYARPGRDVLVFAFSNQTAMRLVWFLIHWWFVHTWCGLKLALWSWSFRRLVPIPKPTRTTRLIDGNVSKR